MFVLATTYDESIQPGSTICPTFTSNDTKSIPVPASLLKKICSSDCQTLMKKAIEELLMEATEFGVSDEGKSFGYHKIENSSLKYEILLAPFSSYEWNLCKDIPIEFRFNLVVKPIVENAKLPHSLILSDKRREYLQRIFDSQSLMVKLPIQPLYEYQNHPENHHVYLKKAK